METSCQAGAAACCCPFAHINWLWYVVAVVVAFAAGALWYSKLFRKTWMEVNQIDPQQQVSKANMISTLLLQFLSTAVLGLMFFILVQQSLCLAIIVTIGIAAWLKSTLKFRMADIKRFWKAAWIDVGYFCVVAVIFMLFASIRCCC